MTNWTEAQGRAIQMWHKNVLIEAGAGSGKTAVIVEHYGDILYKIGNTKDALKNWNLADKIGGGSDFLKQKILHKKLYE